LAICTAAPATAPEAHIHQYLVKDQCDGDGDTNDDGQPR
jgi:hypothetical protein